MVDLIPSVLELWNRSKSPTFESEPFSAKKQTMLIVFFDVLSLGSPSTNRTAVAPNAFGYQSRVGLLGRPFLALISGDALASHDVSSSKKTIHLRFVVI